MSFFKKINHDGKEISIIADWQEKKVLSWKDVLDRMAATIQKCNGCGCDECKALIKRIQAFLWGTPDSHNYKEKISV